VDLTLAEQTLLIALDDEKGRDTTQWGSGVGLAGALLLDLARLELLTADGDGKLTALDGPQPADELLRDAHAAIRGSSESRSARAWVQRLPRELKPLRQRLARGLAQRGILAEQHHKLLGIVPSTRFPTIDPGPEQELRARLRDVLLGDREPTEQEALLVGLLEPLGLIGSLVSRDQRTAARTRAKAVAEQGVAGTAVREAIHAVQGAVIASVLAATTAATAASQ
jgi:hypothetical protein